MRADLAQQNKALLDLIQRNHAVLLLGAEQLNMIRQKLGLMRDGGPPTVPRPEAGPIN